MKKLKLMGNLVFLLLIAAFIVKSGMLYLQKKSMQSELDNTNQEIAEYKEIKEKMLKERENSDGGKVKEKIARDSLNLRKEGEVTYKIVE